MCAVQNMRTALFVVLLLVFIVCSCDERVEFIGPPAPSQKLLRKAYKDKRPSGQAVQYAILINGAAENRFFADLSVAYQVLLESGFLRENIYILDAKDWIERRERGRLKAREVCFTFDDSLLSQYEIALPVLNKFKIKAFWFIYSKILTGDQHFKKLDKVKFLE